MTQEFHISVTPLENQKYLVRTEKVEPGVPLAEEQLQLPLEEWSARGRHLLNNPLLGLSGKQVGEAANQNLVMLGRSLHEALFQKTLRDSWLTARGIAQHRREALRLRLGLKGDRLPGIPWEVLHDDDRPLTAGTDISFSRYQPNNGHLHVPAAPPDRPLKILMAIAAPSDEESLNLEKECKQLQSELRAYSFATKGQTSFPEVMLKVLRQPDREMLTQALEQGQYQVLHYAGHSSAGDNGGRIYLVSGRTGLTETLNGDDLSGLLANNGVQLAVFNSCRGAYSEVETSETANGERSLAEALVKRGIPAVLAMAERIPDDVALNLSRLLYRNLAQGYPVDLSLNRARQGLISSYGSNQLYWALPILYLHPEFDGYLYKRTTPLTLDAMPEPAAYGEDETDIGEVDWDGLTEEVESPTDEDLDDLDSDDPDRPDDSDDEDDTEFISDLLKQLNNPGLVKPNLAGVGTADTPGAIATSPASRSSSQEEDGEVTDDYEWIRQEYQKVVEPPTAFPLAKWLALGSAAAALLVLGIVLLPDRRPQPDRILSVPSPSPPKTLEPEPVDPNLKRFNTGEVTRRAIAAYQAGQLDEAYAAMEALLERGALQEAESVFKEVPNATSNNDPETLFLRGRLAWQSIKTGDTKYNTDDARRYWENAVARSPADSPHLPKYLNALGFAFYAEEDWRRAEKQWGDALKMTDPTVTSWESLTAHAGLALVVVKLAEAPANPDEEPPTSKAIKLREVALSGAPDRFTTEALAQNWLWLESAIEDWAAIEKLQPE